MTTKTPAPATAPKNDLACILAYLATGLSLSYWTPKGERRLRNGDVAETREKNGTVRTKHLTPSLSGYVYLTRDGVRRLAEQARKKWDDIPADLAASERRHTVAMGRD